MKNHLEALNESFNKINIENTSGNLFEDFIGDESESGIDKEDILDWLSDHEQLWADCEKHFHTDPNWLSADELESFICEHEQACKDYAKAFGFALEENLKESILNESPISPEDKHDSDVIRGIYAKMRQPGTKQFSDEETAIMKKYGLDFSRDSWGRRDNTGLVTSDKRSLHNAPIDRSTKHGRYGHEDDVNFADRARKRNQRNIDWQYRKSTPRATHDTLNSNGQWGNKKQSWSRAYDDEKMRADYKDIYNDLYSKKRDIHADKDLLNYQNNTIDQYKQQISDLQKQLANIENRRDKTQKAYDERKADWKQSIADRRAKKNES